MTYYSALHYAAKAEKYASEASLHNLGNKLTNCITEIPQDIKLELNNGTLTLKAGSKVYIPKGFEADGVTPRFNVVVTRSDIVCSNYATAGNRLIMHNNNAVIGGVRDYVYSGDTSAMNNTTPYAYAYFYNTQTNKMYNGNGSSWVESSLSLPLGMAANNSSSQYTSIDQVFNGFGYIGSTVFALPNVKGLIPNGRNEDGSLKNIEFTLDKVLTYTVSGSSSVNLVINQNGYFISNDTFTYDSDVNFNYQNNNKISYCDGGFISIANGGITSFQPKLPFRAVDQNDFNKLDEEAVKTSGDQTIGGTKTFSNKMNINSANNGIYLKHPDYSSYDAFIRMSNAGLMVGTQDASGWRGRIKVTNTEAALQGITISSTSNGEQIATTAWVRSKAAGFPNYSAAVSIADSTTSYTPPSNGIIQMGYLSAGDNSYSGGVTHSSGIDMVSQYSAYKYSNGGTFWCIVEKGVKYTLTSSQPNKKFIPFK